MMTGIELTLDEKLNYWFKGEKNICQHELELCHALLANDLESILIWYRDLEIKHVREPLTNIINKDWRVNADMWHIYLPVLNGIKKGSYLEYYTGIGLRKQDNPVKPSLLNVLSCFITDVEVLQYTFDDFCNTFGYDNDSIKVLNIYKTCTANAKKLKKTGINWDKLREITQDLI